MDVKKSVRCSLPTACSNRFRSLNNVSSNNEAINESGFVGVGCLQSRSACLHKYGIPVGSWNFSGVYAGTTNKRR